MLEGKAAQRYFATESLVVKTTRMPSRSSDSDKQQQLQPRTEIICVATVECAGSRVAGKTSRRHNGSDDAGGAGSGGGGGCWFLQRSLWR